MAFKTYENLSRSGQQAYKDFMWGDGSLKIAYDERTSKILLVTGREGNRKGDRNRYFIYEDDKFYVSFLAYNDVEAITLASKQKPRTETHPNVDNMHAPKYRIHITYIHFDAWNYDFNTNGPAKVVENTTFSKVTIYVDDSERESQDKEVRKTAKSAFAHIRKAIKAFRYSPKYKHLYPLSWQGDDTNCGIWKLRVETLRYFKDWFIIEGDLEELLQQAEAKARAEWIERVSRQEANKKAHTRIYVAPPVYQALNTLGLSWPVTKEELKKKYRTLAMQHHPDRGGNEDTFKSLNNANDLLLKELS